MQPAVGDYEIEDYDAEFLNSLNLKASLVFNHTSSLPALLIVGRNRGRIMNCLVFIDVSDRTLMIPPSLVPQSELEVHHITKRSLK